MLMRLLILSCAATLVSASAFASTRYQCQETLHTAEKKEVNLRIAYRMTAFGSIKDLHYQYTVADGELFTEATGKMTCDNKMTATQVHCVPESPDPVLSKVIFTARWVAPVLHGTDETALLACEHD